MADVIAALEAAYPPRLAEDWDAVGLVCGDPDAPVAEVYQTKFVSGARP